MNIEQEIFKKSKVDFSKLLEYGFIQENNEYIYSKLLNNKKFSADVIIFEDGNILGKVIDLKTNEEYSNIKTPMEGTFVSGIRNEYKNILYDIKEKCFNDVYFIMDQSNIIANKIFEKYNISPEFLWERFPNYGVFRHEDNNKWFAIIMDIDEHKLTKKEHKNIEILNVKLDEKLVSKYLESEGFYEAYHMSHKTWITIPLDGRISIDEILNLVDISYSNTM